MKTSEILELEEAVCRFGDLLISWITGEEESAQARPVLGYLTFKGETLEITAEKQFQDIVKDMFNQDIGTHWTDGIKTVEINGTQINGAYFSYLKEHPELFPGIEQVRSFFEQKIVTAKKPALILERTYGGSVFLDGFPDAETARSFFLEELNSAKENGLTVELIGNTFKAYEPKKPYVAAIRATLVF